MKRRRGERPSAECGETLFLRRGTSDSDGKRRASTGDRLGRTNGAMKLVLNVGGANKTIPLPPHYQGWEHILLTSIPGRTRCRLRCPELTTLLASQFDAVYCSHTLEHYYRHDVSRVLAGFRHVLNSDGFAEIRVPDLADLMQTVVRRGLDVDDLFYQSPAGPMTATTCSTAWARKSTQR